MLLIVSSPIGSIEEMSLQGAKTLTTSDVILCEDTRTFVPFYKKVCNLYSLTPKQYQTIILFYKDKEFELLPKIINDLELNKTVSLVSEAGSPIVSDPGRLLVEKCQIRNIPFTSVPGPSAVINCAVLSGCRMENFLFVGFLSKKESQVLKQFQIYKEMSNKLKYLEVCFFESANRINKTLKILAQIIPDSKVYVCREMNKKFEELVIGIPSELAVRKYKGELTVAVKIG